MDSQRTEEPTPRKLRKARERGEVATSRLLSSALVILGVSMAIGFGADTMLARWRGLATTLLSGSLPPREGVALSAEVAAGLLAWPLTAAVVCGALAGFLQVGPLFAPKAMAPDLARIDPARGLARMFSPAEMGARLGGLALCAVLFAIGADVLLASVPGLAGRTDGGARFVLGASARVIEALLWRTLPVIALAGAIAVVYQRWRFHRAQRMTRRERLQEQRETEGEPESRRRRAELHRELATGMSEQESLTEAAIVVRGIGRAVVLCWRRSSDAPPTVGLVARGPRVSRIVARAAAEEVPVVHDERLAGELERLSAGKTLARAALLRLARHLSKHSRR